MCGIAGLILDEPDTRAAGWLAEMTQRLHHRGPDAGGAVLFGPNGVPALTRTLGRPEEPADWGYITCRIALGARRLAILDLSDAARQPMSAPDGHAWIIHNGEIYNHRELRAELAARGATFAGHSDTEVALAAYRAWGVDCFARFEGMWAMAIADWAAGRIVLSRDRLGIKPLYLAQFEAGIAFASEIKSLLALPGAARGVNEALLRDFLVDGLTDHAEATLFDGIFAMPPGCFIEFDQRRRGALRHVGIAARYWQPPVGWESADDAPAPTQIRDTLAAAVTSHLTSDVPVGSCLSGGIDSSAIVSLAARAVAKDRAAGPHWSQHVFTATLPGSPLDESAHAAAVAGSIAGLNAHQVTPTAEGLLADLDKLLWHQEQPFGSPSIFMQWTVMRLARQTGVTVLLDGQGGDELFCGYEGYWPPMLAHLARRGHMLALARQFRSVPTDAFRRGDLALRGAAHLLPSATRRALALRGAARRNAWLSPELFDVADPADLFESLRIVPPAEPEALHAGPAMSRHMWRILLADSLPGLLRFEDRSSMAFSVEARVPMLDRAVVESAMTLPPRAKLEGGVTKVALRAALKGIVPESILARRDKIGFAAPTVDWMRGALRPWQRDLTASASFRERGCFHASGIAELEKRLDAGDGTAALALWRAALTEGWARKFLDGVA